MSASDRSDERRARRVRRAGGLLPALTISLAVHAAALAAFTAVAFPGRPPAGEHVIVLELESLPALDDALASEAWAPAAPDPPRAPAPAPDVAPDLAEDEPLLAEAAAQQPAPPDDARWLYEVLADGGRAAAVAGEPRAPAAPSSAAPIAHAGEWQGPPAPQADDIAEAPPSLPSVASAAVLAPVPLSDNAPPDYPSDARRAGEEGLVLVRARVQADGRVAEVALAQSSGHARLDEAALRAVAGWRFQPALQDGRPVAGGIDLPIRFRLRER